MSLKKAYLIAVLFALLYPMRWWEGRPIIAILLMVASAWSLSAGFEVHELWFLGLALILGYEFISLPKRIRVENERLSRQ